MHWKVEPGLSEVKSKLGELLLVVPEGPLVMVVSGGVVDAVNAGMSTKCVASAWSLRCQTPSLPVSGGQEAPPSKFALRFQGSPLEPGSYCRKLPAASGPRPAADESGRSLPAVLAHDVEPDGGTQVVLQSAWLGVRPSTFR